MNHNAPNVQRHNGVMRARHSGTGPLRNVTPPPATIAMAASAISKSSLLAVIGTGSGAIV
jgi:hypothetical protein